MEGQFSKEQVKNDLLECLKLGNSVRKIITNFKTFEITARYTHPVEHLYMCGFCMILNQKLLPSIILTSRRLQQIRNISVRHVSNF